MEINKEIMKTFKVGDVVKHKVNSAKKKWGFGIIKNYSSFTGIYKVLWFDGEERTHTIELLNRIA